VRGRDHLRDLFRAPAGHTHSRDFMLIFGAFAQGTLDSHCKAAGRRHCRERLEGGRHFLERDFRLRGLNAELPVHEPETALDLAGLNIAPSALDKLLEVDVEGWLAEIPLIREHFAKFGDHLPEGMKQEVDNLEKRLMAAKK
jgi:hypothetical protein